MTAETIAKALGGRKAGAAGWRAVRRMTTARRASRSPTRDDGKVLVRCHAGCDQRDVIAALRARGAVAERPGAARPILAQARSPATGRNPIATP